MEEIPTKQTLTASEDIEVAPPSWEEDTKEINHFGRTVFVFEGRILCISKHVTAGDGLNGGTLQRRRESGRNTGREMLEGD